MLWLAACGVIGLPAFILRSYCVNIDPALAAFVFGIGILSAAFLLSWAAEAAQHDMSAALAIAILALIAVLPEYAVEAVLAWDAGQSFSAATGEVTEEMSRVAANVTGGNRLLIGIGWSAVILIFWFRRRRPLDLRGYLSLELVLLSAATALSFIIFTTGQVHMALAGVLIALYVFYLWQSSRQEAVEPDLLGPALAIGNLSRPRRRAVVLALFVYAAAVILVAAEPFVEALVGTGEDLGIEEFILIQWVAPLASESPEIIVAILFSLQASPMDGMSTLISAGLSQLTLLVGSMVVIFSIAAGEPLNFVLDDRQAVEFLLTSAMSVFAILLIIPRVIGWKSGAALIVLFAAHLAIPNEAARLTFAYIFLGLSAGLLALNHRHLLALLPRKSG